MDGPRALTGDGERTYLQIVLFQSFIFAYK